MKLSCRPHTGTGLVVTSACLHRRATSGPDGRVAPNAQRRLVALGARRALLCLRCVRCATLLACLATRHTRRRAQTDEIQVYDAEITAPGQFNLTWHNNYTPSGRTQPAFPGGMVPNHALNGVPEWAYGVTDWFEAGTYLPVYTLTSDGRLLFDSVKLRALFVVPDAHDRTLFYGLNFELSYNTPHWEPAASRARCARSSACTSAAST